MRASDFLLISKKLKRVDLRKILSDVLKENQRDIIDLQQEQLSAGLADKGDPIEPAYTKNTVARKQKKGQPTDRVTLKDKGAFYRNMHAKFAKDHFEISSRNGKTPKLVDKYHGNRGGDVFGLTDENKAYLAAMIKPELQRRFKEQALR